jgi:hypothetical protein
MLAGRSLLARVRKTASPRRVLARQGEKFRRYNLVGKECYKQIMDPPGATAMTRMQETSRRDCAAGGSGVALAVLLAVAFAAGGYAPSAEARCCRHGARFAGGLFVGAVIARPFYVYAPPVYYAPPAYYPTPTYYAPPVYYPPPAYYPPPPAVVYASPPAYVEQQGRGSTPEPALSIEERLHRLQSACGQGLLSAPECEAKRQELLRLM